jgi:hypothetical protein
MRAKLFLAILALSGSPVFAAPMKALPEGVYRGEGVDKSAQGERPFKRTISIKGDEISDSTEIGGFCATGFKKLKIDPDGSAQFIDDTGKILASGKCADNRCEFKLEKPEFSISESYVFEKDILIFERTIKSKADGESFESAVLRRAPQD